jgi:prepilin-type processing-associated H-X9-DG protein
MAKSDFAFIVGSKWSQFGPGPDLGPSSNAWNYGVIGIGFPSAATTKSMNGIMFAHATFALKQITDGTTSTYMLGEKSVDPLRYIDPGADGGGLGDDQGPLVSDERDSVRYTYYDTANPKNSLIPLPDTPGVDATWQFGGPHSGGFIMAFCDGSVHTVSFNIDPLVHSYLGNRKDGQTFDRSDIY